MNLRNGLFQSASDTADSLVSGVASTLLGGATIGSSITSCSSETSAQLSEIHTLMAEVSGRLSNLRDSASSLEMSRLQDLVAGAASQVGSNIAARGILLSQQATSSGISYARRYVEKKIGLAALALEIIQNSTTAVYAGVLALILLRVESKLGKLKDSINEINLELQNIVDGVRVAQDVFDVSTSDMSSESIERAIVIIRSAERRIRLASGIMENSGKLSRSTLNETSTQVNNAISELSQGENLLSAILGPGLASEIAADQEKFIKKIDSWDRIQDALSDRWKKVEDAATSSKKIPGLLKSASDAYSDAKKWIGYAKILPESISFTASSSIKDSVVLELQKIRGMLVDSIEILERENAGAKERIQVSHQLNLVRIRLANLLLAASQETSQIKNEWYDDVQEIVSNPMWGDETLSLLKNMEIYSLLGASYKESNSTANGPYDWSLRARKTAGTVLSRVSSMEILSKKLSEKLGRSFLGPWAIAEGYLKSAGVDDPLLSLVTGELPSKIERALDVAIKIKDSYQSGGFSRNRGTPCIEQSRSQLPPADADNAEIMLVNSERIDHLRTQDMFSVIEESYLTSSQREILASQTVKTLSNN